MLRLYASSALLPSLVPLTNAANGLLSTAKQGEKFVNNSQDLLVLLSQIVWALFIIPAAIEFIDALRRPENRFPKSTGASKTFWVIALAGSFVFTIGWLVTPLYLFRVYLPGRKLDPAVPDPMAPAPEVPERPFK